jgi:hypothetical protein
MIDQHLTEADLDAIEREWQQDMARTFVAMDALVKRAESELAAGRDLGIAQEDRDMISEELADNIEFMAQLLGH